MSLLIQENANALKQAISQSTSSFRARSMMAISKALKKLSIMTAGAALVGFGSLGIAPTTQAAIISGTTIGTVQEGQVFGLSAGDTWIGRFTYDSEEPIFSFGGVPFLISLTSLEITFGTQTFSRADDADFPLFPAAVVVNENGSFQGLDFFGMKGSDIEFFFGPTTDTNSSNLWQARNGENEASGSLSYELDTTSVPEPTSILGLLAISAFGAVSAVKRQH